MTVIELRSDEIFDASRERPEHRGVDLAERFGDWLLYGGEAMGADAERGSSIASEGADVQPTADFPAAIDLASLNGSNGFRIDGIDAYDRSGRSVASAGDVNGDGFDDVIIGAERADADGNSYAGESYVVFGSGAGFAASIDLASLDGANGFRLDGVDNYNYSGSSVASAGDINGDGFDDIVIGAYGADSYAGESYVVFGKAGGFAASIDLANLDGANGFRLDGIDSGDVNGRSVSSAGDVNGDGFDDLFIGADGADPDGVSSAGESYVVFGKAEPFGAAFDLTSLDGSNGFRLDGTDFRGFSGDPVAAAGDINGDGFGDLIIGASGYGDDYYSGETFVVFGKAGGFSASLDLASLDGANGFRLGGVNEDDYSGRSVASAGDVNGDGFDDIVIGANGADPNGDLSAGASYVVFGKADAFEANFDLSSLDGANGFRIDGIDAFDFSGFSVASAGDVNADGFDDLIIGTPNAESDDSFSAGESYVVFGKAGGFSASLDPASLDGTNGFRIDGIDSADLAGASVASAGDVNGDGFDDIVIGAYGADPNGDSSAGESYVVFGRAPTEAVKRIGAEADQTIRGGAFDDTLGGRGGDDLLAGAGGDDRLFGGPGTDTLKGGGGDDRLVVSTGRDVMKGGAGRDSFALDDDVDTSERPQITDFTSGMDMFEIDSEDFGGGLTPGALDPDAFRVNATGEAQDADDRFIYNSTNGKLFSDADGNGAGESALLARLADAPMIEAGDFIVV